MRRHARGAAVNHVLPHGELRAANVTFTKQLIAVFCSASCTRLKHFVLISTLSDTGLTDHGSADVESMPFPSIPLSILQGSPSGYATTKWCAERLLVQAMEHPHSCFASSSSSLRKPTGTILRLGMMSWATDTGVGNDADCLPRSTHSAKALL